MRFWTIWTLPAMSFDERLRRTRDWAALAIAVRLPLRIRYWSMVANISEASQSVALCRQHVNSMTVLELMDNIDTPKDKS